MSEWLIMRKIQQVLGADTCPGFHCARAELLQVPFRLLELAEVHFQQLPLGNLRVFAEAATHPAPFHIPHLLSQRHRVTQQRVARLAHVRADHLPASDCEIVSEGKCL